jgi:hypothetical protein
MNRAKEGVRSDLPIISAVMTGHIGTENNLRWPRQAWLRPKGALAEPCRRCKNVAAMYRHPGRLRVVATLLSLTFVLVTVVYSICPVCLSELLGSTQPTGVSLTSHHRVDCDRDGCSCCGFQVVMARCQGFVGPSATIPTSRVPTLLEPADYVFDFYHPPR